MKKNRFFLIGLLLAIVVSFFPFLSLAQETISVPFTAVEEEEQKKESCCDKKWYLGAEAIYVADSRIFDFFPGPNEVATGGVLDLSYHVLTRMAGHMKAYESGEFSMDIGTFAAYEKAQRLYPSGK